jgi:hypothetical protein
VPGIARYIRNYQIRGAAQAVAGEIQTARAKAINKNVNFGVVFLTVDTQTYRYAIEDDMTNGNSGVRPAVATLLAANDPAQVGPARLLPPGIIFGTGCTGFAANDSGLRFNRFGSWCDPGTGTCPAIGTGQNLVMNPNQATALITGAVGTTICLVQPMTGLRRTVVVAPGGRVRVQP